MSKTKVDLSDFSYNEDEKDSSPMGFIAEKSKNLSREQSEVALKVNIHSKETYGSEQQNTTENIRKKDVYYTENGRKESTENIRNNVVEKNVRKPKSTDTSTDDGRKTIGKDTDINTLVGFQRQAFFAIAQQAKDAGFSDDYGNRICPPINGGVFAEQILKRAYKQAKDVIYELKVAGFLSVYKVKNGRGGFVQYLIFKNHYQSFLLNGNLSQTTENGRITYGKSTDKSTDTPTDTLSSSRSSSSLIKEKELTPTSGLTGEWAAVQTPLELKNLGFGLHQVLQIKGLNQLTAKELQDSLDHFALDLKDGLKIRTNPLNYLMGILVKNGRPYISSSYLKSQEEEISEYLSKIESLAIAKESLLKEKMDADFEVWFSKLSKEEMVKFVSPTSISAIGSPIYKKMIKEFFLNSIANTTL